MTNNKQQTAMEWLWEIAYNRDLTLEDWKQAKEMEKQQRISDYYQGACDESDSHGAQYICESDAEQWYEKTYGGNK